MPASPTRKSPKSDFLNRIGSALALATALSASANLKAGVAQGADPVVVMQTTRGTMAIRVYASMAPKTASNFLDLVSRGFYDGKTFHRVESWCIQGGCPFGNGQGSFTDPDTGQTRYIPLEINRKLGHYAPGVVAMARSSNPNSASCQFYILKKAMPQLNGQYAVFGGVIQGLNTIYGIGPGDRIIHAEIASNGGGDNQSSSETNQNPRQGSGQEPTPTPSQGGGSGF
ncbi:MAG: peptidylprolyl isomerase [Cyanobacteria bacterium REEB67]|nr:peptidylprolyl isomerase [Cyanobacteria bacterium REEB67]